MAERDELLNLGLKASRSGDGQTALGYFEQVLKLDPGNFSAQYLRAAELAGSGQFAAAREAFERTLQQYPEQLSCRFQTGLLMLTLGDVKQAQATLSSLLDLPEDHHLRLFTEAINALCADDLALAEDRFRAGLARNSENPPLSGDMAALLQKVVRLRSATDTAVADSAPVSEEATPASSTSMAFLLSTLHGGRSRH